MSLLPLFFLLLSEHTVSNWDTDCTLPVSVQDKRTVRLYCPTCGVLGQ
jgi:predicted RNA-binding Zn-ribbon protein involved in translation (DUF1610 family)